MELFVSLLAELFIRPPVLIKILSLKFKIFHVIVLLLILTKKQLDEVHVNITL